MNRITKFSVLCLLVATASLHAQEKKESGFDVSKFMKRLDTNGNGKVDPSEVKDERTRGFLRKAGVDPSKPISIDGFAKKIKKQRSDKASKSSSLQQSPGFGVDREDSGNAMSFAVSDEERAPAKRTRGSRQYSDGAVKMLEWTLNKYDKNKDGKLDANEVSKGRWADPPAKDSDKNKDGQLSRTELLERYQQREDRKEKEKKRSSSRSSSSSRSKDRSRKETGSRRVSSRKESASKSGGSADEREKARKVRKGYESYVDGVFKRYDKNKNGQLEKSEIAEMRKKPDMAIDSDKDKQISRSELLDSYLKNAGVSSNKDNSSSTAKKKSGKLTSSSPSNAGSRPQLTSKDKNRNGQIEMSEFATEWNLAKVEEFYAKDKNRDGVITASEWNQK